MNTIKVQVAADLLWDGSAVLRENMKPEEYTLYVSGLFFYKYLTDHLLQTLGAQGLISGDSADALQASYFTTGVVNVDDATWNEWRNMGVYNIPADLTFYAMVQRYRSGDLTIANLLNALHTIESLDPRLVDIFGSLRFNDKALGFTEPDRVANVGALMDRWSMLGLPDNEGGPAAVFEELLGRCTTELGKGSRSLVVPYNICRLMKRLALQDRNTDEQFTLYDPFMASGSLLLADAEQEKNSENITYYGEESTRGWYRIACMNAIINQTSPQQILFSNGPVLARSGIVRDGDFADGIVLNGPYRTEWKEPGDPKMDPRFVPYRIVPTLKKADVAFLLHGLYCLNDDGVMVAILPPRILFNRQAEGRLREVLVRKGLLDAVIGLPPKMYYTTEIPTVILVIRKRPKYDNVLFIDASRDFTYGRKHNFLETEQIERIWQTYVDRKPVPQFASIATRQEIENRSFNLTISHYVDAFAGDQQVKPMDDVRESLRAIDQEMEETRKEIMELLSEMDVTDDAKDLLAIAKDVLKL